MKDAVTKPAESLRVLLTDLIDYAGLFPPAALDMKSAVANYSRYLQGEYSWMLGRFVLPASRLTEFEQALPRNEQPWRLSVLLGPNLEDDVTALQEFAPRCSKLAAIDCVEMKVVAVDEIEKAHQLIATGATTYFEIRPFDCTELLHKIHDIGGRAKIRTGGLTPDAIPPSDIVADFLMQCAKHDVPFKATAGLHHPIRCCKPLTYEPDAPTGMMHGFLNVFIAATASWANGKTIESKHNFSLHAATQTRPEAILSAPFPSRVTADVKQIERWLRMPSPFDIRDDGIHQPLMLPTTIIEQARRNFAISFGSCSFEEPIADLKALNLL